jgi:hypothetical protein
MPVLVQDVFVTLAAIAAASIVVRRVFVTVRPDGGSSKCASCPAAQHKRTELADSQIARLRD